MKLPNSQKVANFWNSLITPLVHAVTLIAQWRDEQNAVLNVSSKWASLLFFACTITRYKPAVNCYNCMGLKRRVDDIFRHNSRNFLGRVRTSLKTLSPESGLKINTRTWHFSWTSRRSSNHKNDSRFKRPAPATNVTCNLRDKFLSFLTTIKVEDEPWNARRVFGIDSDRDCCFGK